MPTVEELVEPSYLAGLDSLSLGEVRAKRAECQDLEVALSYLRRVLQGRLDIVHAELARRGQGGHDIESLVEQLPDILSDRVHGPGLGRLPTLMAPGELPAELTAEADQVIGEEQLATIDQCSDADLETVAEAIGELERRVSGQRRLLHDVIDALQAEIVRRYKTGEATVDSLLR